MPASGPKHSQRRDAGGAARLHPQRQAPLRRRKRVGDRGGREVHSHGFPVAPVVSLSSLGAGGMAARRALFVLRPHGALPPASASRHRLTPARPCAVAAISGGAGWARRCGESGESGERKAWFGTLISSASRWGPSGIWGTGEVFRRCGSAAIGFRACRS